MAGLRVLVTGFETFDTLAFNPSERVVRRIALAAPRSGIDLTTEVLPTEYDRSGEIIEQLIRRCRPDIFIGTGVSASRPIINLERIALNIDDAAIPDNAGIARSGTFIDPDGPLALEARCDLQPVLRRLRRHELRCAISTHAGTYVCNHTYYKALHAIQRSGLATRCLFIHFPMTAPDDVAPMAGCFTIGALIDAVELAIAELRGQVATPV